MSSGLWNICKGVFTPKRALGFVEYGKKMFCSLKCKVRIDGRRKKRNGEQHQVDLKTLLVESSTWRGVIRTTTITCLAAAHKGPVVARTCVTLVVKLDINSWRGFDFGFDHLNGVPTALIEDVS